jgi:hypothetical protein
LFKEKGIKVKREVKKKGRKKIKKKERRRNANWQRVNLPQFRVGVGRRKQHKIGSAWKELKHASLLMRPEITKKLMESIKSNAPSEIIVHDQHRKQQKSHE